MQNLEIAARQSFLTTLNGYRALVLDSSYRPIDIVNWQRAICLDLFEKVCSIATTLLQYNWQLESVPFMSTVVMQQSSRALFHGWRCQIHGVRTSI